MQKLIKNDWRRECEEVFDRTQILRHDDHPEGLDVDRIRFYKSGCLTLDSNLGHIISILRGKGRLQLTGSDKQVYNLDVGVHLYLPSGPQGVIDADSGTEILHVSSSSASQARGKKFLLRNEMFLAACASGSQSLRWVLTPQYLSRRIFLDHDPILLSKSGNPVSWFHTTMFDVTGLPKNEDGKPVFKMSYNSRTEVNFCYDVKGTARVRMAQHPYRETKQLWGPWLPLDGDSTYHLNETTQTFRNKHEVYISEGYVSLFCLFDPAPTGIEHHRPGEYSDYELLSQVIGTKLYETYAREIARYDEMVDQLSVAKAKDKLNTFHGTPIWDLYLQGREAQTAIEAKLIKTVATENNGREHILAQWIGRI